MGFVRFLSVVVIETQGELLCEDHGNVKCKSGRILTFWSILPVPPCVGDNKYDKISAAPGPFVQSSLRWAADLCNKTKI